MCYIYDGQEEGSLFEIKAPEPLDIEVALFDINQYRAMHGLRPVKLNPYLINASLLHAEDMARNGMVEHIGTDQSEFIDRMERSGYKSSVAGENIAGGQSNWNSVFKDWQESPGHNATLLMPDAKEFGVALVFDKTTRYNYYWAMLMAAPFSDLFEN